MTDNVTSLRPIENAGDPTRHEPVARLHAFIKEAELLTEWEHSDVELDPANSDERKLGPLTPIEIEYYTIGTLLQEVLRQTLIDIEANSTDQIAAIMRAERVNMLQATQLYRERISELLEPDDQSYLHKAAITTGHCMAAYEWSVRQRYDTFLGQLIVRRGHIVYAYG